MPHPLSDRKPLGHRLTFRDAPIGTAKCLLCGAFLTIDDIAAGVPCELRPREGFFPVNGKKKRP